MGIIEHILLVGWLVGHERKPNLTVRPTSILRLLQNTTAMETRG